jgi:putative lipoic acid-binding regulatory protein
MSDTPLPPAGPLREDLWIFPALHSVKVMGLATAPLADIITAIVQSQVPAFTLESPRVQPSRNGTYVSLTFSVYLTQREQLQAIYADLAAHEAVKWTL